MRNTIKALMPTYGAGQSLSIGTSTQNLALSASGAEMSNLYLYNSGSAAVYVRVGKGAQTATTADFPIPPGAAVVIGKPIGADNLAGIAGSGTNVLMVIPCDGV